MWCDGITYDNECYAYYYGGVLFWTEGPCLSDGVEEEVLLGMKLAPNPAGDISGIYLHTNVNGPVQIRCSILQVNSGWNTASAAQQAIISHLIPVSCRVACI